MPAVDVSLTICARGADGGLVPPRTKKNHSVMVKRLNRALLLPSEAYREWEKAALLSWIKAGVCKRVYGVDALLWLQGEVICEPVNCQALIYRDRLVGDAVGFYQAIGDFLEAAGIVANDKWIVSWDGTRLLKDALRPRVELRLTSAVGAEVQEPLFAMAGAAQKEDEDW